MIRCAFGKAHAAQAGWPWWGRLAWWTLALPLALAAWSAGLAGDRGRRIGYGFSGLLTLVYLGIALPGGGSNDQVVQADRATAASSTSRPPGDTTTTSSASTSTATRARSTPPTSTSASASSTTTSELAPDDRVTAVEQSRELLAALEIAPRHEPVPYRRDDWDGGGWADADDDCQNTRHEVLEAESREPVSFDGNERCRVSTGRWLDPYDGESEMFTSADATIDHVVALKHAYVSGGWAWDMATKLAFANDLHPPALAVASEASNSGKGHAAPDEWRPGSPSRWCAYAIGWISIKARWHLTVIENEVAALAEMLDTCTDEASTGPNVATLDAGTEPADIVLAPTTTTSPPTTAPTTTTTNPPTTSPPAPATSPPTTPPPTTPAPTSPPATAAPTGACDPSYPGVCIPPAPPDLDCGDIPHKRFTVLSPDPHGFDGNDDDGIGCES